MGKSAKVTTGIAVVLSLFFSDGCVGSSANGLAIDEEFIPEPDPVEAES